VFITNVSVDIRYRGQNIGGILIQQIKKYALTKDIKKILLEVNQKNTKAINFYKKHGFNIFESTLKTLTMHHTLERDYNQEFQDTTDHKYAYDFDFDIMHKYMIQSFKPFFNSGNVLELGSFKGAFTKRLLEHFNTVTCVEASDEAVKVAKKLLGDKVEIYTSLFENVILPTKYDNIILTHVLEHIDNPVCFIKQVHENWLSESGKLFIVCPNANAASRRIAVKMGLITHNTAITPAEKEHGHRITYTLDTLIRDVREAGLTIHHQSGIFFKALANFQWDQLLQTDIISKEYLDGCFDLGKEYPDLCSSIMVICKK
jgi:2-polyprenyl-3-methyl-5-hydroxy-6-metoxy-1,4-benzoquinol methylase